MKTKRELPNNTLAECALIGWLIRSPKLLGRINDRITEMSFWGDGLGKIYKVLQEEVKRGREISETTIGEELTQRRINLAGDNQGVVRMCLDYADSCPDSPEVLFDQYVEIVAGKERDRVAIVTLQNALYQAERMNLNGESGKYLEDIAKNLVEIANPRTEKEKKKGNEMAFPREALTGWLERYVEWQEGTTEAPLAFHAAGGLAVLSLVLNRKCWVWSGGKQYPLWWSVIAGESADRKTTVVDRAVQFAKKFDPNILLVDGWGSAEGMVKYVAGAQPVDPVVGLTLQDAGTMFKKLLGGKSDVPGGGAALATRFYDCQDGQIDNPTKQGNTSIQNPYFLVFGAATMDSVGLLYGDHAVESGLQNRFVPFFASSDLCLPIPQEPDKAMQAVLMSELKGIVTFAESVGNYRLDPVAVELYGQWYREHKKGVTTLTKRDPNHLIRYAMLVAILRGHRMIMAEDVSLGIVMVDYWSNVAKYLQDHYSSSARGRVENAIIYNLEKVHPGGLSRRILQQRIRAKCNPELFREALGRLSSQRIIRLQDDDLYHLTSH